MSTHAAVEPEPSLSQFLQQQDLDKVKHFSLSDRRYNLRFGNSRLAAIMHVGLAMSEEHMYTPFLEIFVYHADDEVTVHLVPHKKLPESLCYRTKIRSAVTSNVVNTVLGLLRSLPSKGRYRTCLEELVHLQPEPTEAAVEPDSGISGVFAHLHRQLPRADKAFRVRTGVEEYPVAYLYTIPAKDGRVRVHLQRPRGDLGYLYTADLTEDSKCVRLERTAWDVVIAVFASARSASDLAHKLAVAAATNHIRKRVQAAAEPQHKLSAFDFASGLHQQMRDGAPVRIGKRLFLMFSSRREDRDFVQLHFQIPGDPGEVRVNVHDNDVAQATVYVPPRIGRLCNNSRAPDLEHGPAPVMLKKFLTGLKINCNTDQFSGYDNVYELLEKLPGLSVSVEAAAEPAQDPREILCDKLKAKYDLELDPEKITYLGRDGLDYNGDVDWESKNLTKIPVRFRSVTGYFNCSYNHLTTLAGAPGHVGVDFSCSQNRLTTLEHAPGRVGGGFICSDNHLTSLEHAPGHVGGYFYCDSNHLTTLEHAPGHVGGYFYCFNNHLPPGTKKPVGVKGRFYLGVQTPAPVHGAVEPESVGNHVATPDEVAEILFAYQRIRPNRDIRFHSTIRLVYDHVTVAIDLGAPADPQLRELGADAVVVALWCGPLLLWAREVDDAEQVRQVGLAVAAVEAALSKKADPAQKARVLLEIRRRWAPKAGPVTQKYISDLHKHLQDMEATAAAEPEPKPVRMHLFDDLVALVPGTKRLEIDGAAVAFGQEKSLVPYADSRMFIHVTTPSGTTKFRVYDFPMPRANTIQPEIDVVLQELESMRKLWLRVRKAQNTRQLLAGIVKYAVLAHKAPFPGGHEVEI